MSALETAYSDVKILAEVRNSSPKCHDLSTLQKDYHCFQRAIRQKDAEAWEQIYQLYRPLLWKWIVAHPHFANTGEDIDYFANRALEKMWHALTPEKFAKFSGLKPLLAYLKMCVNSAIVDYLRAEKQHWFITQLIEEDPAYAFVSTEIQLESEAQRLRFWECIRKRLKNETEYKLLYYRFILDIKPQQICIQFGDVFPNVEMIYLLTQNILARLRRCPEMTTYKEEPELLGSPSRFEC